MALELYYMVEHACIQQRLKQRQMNQWVLGQLFHLFPDSILLMSDDGLVETVDCHGNFPDIDDLPVWTCSGDSVVSATNAENSQSSNSSYMYQLPSTSSRVTCMREEEKVEPKFYFQFVK